MIVGIRAHDLVKGSIDEVLTSAENEGFEAVQLVFKKALINQPFNKENVAVNPAMKRPLAFKCVPSLNKLASPISVTRAF